MFLGGRDKSGHDDVSVWGDEMDELEDLKSANATLIAQSQTLSALDEARVQILGKNGNVTLRLKSLGGMSPEERREFGPKINGLRDDATARIAERKAALDAAALPGPGRHGSGWTPRRWRRSWPPSGST